MNQRLTLIAVVACVAAGIAYAQQFPISTRWPTRSSRIQSASCEQLWEKKGARSLRKSRSHRASEERPGDAYRIPEPGRRKIANKMFECGMIP